MAGRARRYGATHNGGSHTFPRKGNRQNHQSQNPRRHQQHTPNNTVEPPFPTPLATPLTPPDSAGGLSFFPGPDCQNVTFFPPRFVANISPALLAGSRKPENLLQNIFCPPEARKGFFRIKTRQNFPPPPCPALAPFRRPCPSGALSKII